jgi:site-specific DNA recombinase
MTFRTTHPFQQQNRVSTYTRVSPGPFQADGFSIEAQLTEMREFAAARGWVIVAEFVDVSVSGQTMERPELDAMKAAAAEGSFDILLVHELSRLSRSSVYETFEIFEFLGRYNVGFASVKEPQFDLSSPNGRFVLTIIAAVNQYYIDILSMHTQKSKHQRAREGLYNASIPPYGYRHTGDPKTPPQIVPEEADAIRLIFERYASGRHSFMELADLLNDRGYRTRAGKRFSKDTVADMIRNQFYAGKVVYRAGSRRQDLGEVYTGLHEALIPEELWEACRQVRQQHHTVSRPFHPKVRAYLLGQLAHCHVCHRKLRVQNTPTGLYYREMSTARGFDDCPNAQLGTRADPLYAQINAIVRELSLPPDWREELSALIGEDQEVATLQNRRARLIAERRRLKEAYIRGDFDEDADLYRRDLQRIRRELEQLPSEDELHQIEQAATYLESLAEIWDEAEEGDQRDLLRLMVREVQVNVAQGRLLSLTPTAPFIPLFRALPILEERDLGAFAPVWPPEMAGSLPYPSLPSLTHPTEGLLDGVAPPFLLAWPWQPEADARISPTLSDALKERRRLSVEGGRVLEVAHPGVPTLLLDTRKWEHVTLEQRSLEQALALPEGTVAYLETPLALQAHPDRAALVDRVVQLLERQGYWHVYDLLPASMPAHWLYTYFPDTWSLALGAYWTAYQFYQALRKKGLHVRQQEHTFYQPVSLSAALEIAQGRAGPLGLLNDPAYQAGLDRLAAEVEERGGETLIGSEVTLVEVTALKGEPPPRRRRGKKAT